MSAKTGIAWTDATWNPTRGCALVSHGCTNCYAMKQAHRFASLGGAYEGLTKMTSHGPVWTGEVRALPELLDQPLRWTEPRRIFVDSMSDLFHEDVPDEFIDRVFAVMGLARRHTFQILTKRPERMRSYLSTLTFDRLIACCNRSADGGDHRPGAYSLASIEGRGTRARFVAGDKTAFWPFPKLPMRHVWLGVSVENQATADERIPLLVQMPAAVRFLSCEPLLERIVLRPDWLPYETDNNGPIYRGIDWVIIGGESGSKARPFHLQWARDLIKQCKAAGVPAFVKQIGSSAFRCDDDDEEERTWPMRAEYKDRAGADPSEWPADLRIQQFPSSPLSIQKSSCCERGAAAHSSP